MHRLGAILLGFLLVSSCVAADTPAHPQTVTLGTAAKAVATTVEGNPVPVQWPLGVPLYLTARESEYDLKLLSITWHVDPSWSDENSLRLAGGRELVLATGTRPRTVTVILIAAKHDSADMLRMKIDLVLPKDEPVGPAPSPTPPPTPLPPAPPGPTPSPTPPANARVTTIATLAAMHVPAYPGRGAMARNLADVYDMVATSISKAVAINPPPDELRAYTEPESLVTATGVVVRQKLGTDVERWRPFFAALRDYLNDLSRQGKLATAGDHIPVFRDIAAGLRTLD